MNEFIFESIHFRMESDTGSKTVLAGRRERHKAERVQKIVGVAERMFREYGYAQTRMEDIATEADVSVGTIYNYFQNKTDLLLMIVSMNDANIVADIEALADLPPDDIVQRVCEVFFITTRHALEGLGRENWCHLLATSIVQQDSQLGQNYMALTQRLLDRVIATLQDLQERGHITKTCDVAHIARLLFRIESTLYLDLVSNEKMSFEDYKAQLIADAHYILRE